MESTQQRAVLKALRTTQEGGQRESEQRARREATTLGRLELRRGEDAAMALWVPQEKAGPCGFTEARRGEKGREVSCGWPLRSCDDKKVSLYLLAWQLKAAVEFCGKCGKERRNEPIEGGLQVLEEAGEDGRWSQA